MRRAVLASCLLLALAAPAGAQPVSFLAKTDRTRVGLGEAFVYEVTLSVEDARVDGYRPPDFKAFRVLGEQPSQSTQIQMGGGLSFMRHVYSWRYELQPLATGTVTLGPARVRVAGRELKTAAVTVTVVDGPAGGAAAPRSAPGGVSPLGMMPAPSGPAAEEGRNFLRVVASKTKAYVGEQITVEWFLYLTERQDKYQTLTEPRADGFWSEDLPMPNQQRGLQLTHQSHEGQSYLVAPLLRRALFPLQPGKLTIAPMESEISQVDFFGSTMRTERLKAEPLVIEVQPLPTAGQPPDFDPAAVGRFAVTARVDRERVATGEPVTLTVVVSGQGNLRKVTPPRLEALPGWKIYDPKVAVNLDPGDVIGGTRTAEYLLLPERPGITMVPALALSFFDPQARAYVTERSAPLRLEVVGEAASGPGAPAGSGGAVAGPSGIENVVGLDIRPLRARPSFRRDLGTTFYRSRAFAAVLAAPPLAFALTVLVGRVRERLSQDTERTRRRKLRRLVRRHLRAAEGHLEAGRASPFFIEIDRVLSELLSGKLGRPVAGMSRDELSAELARAGVTSALAEAVIAELEACDRARFAPGDVDEAEMRQALERAGDIILQIERARIRAGEAS